MAKTQTIPRVVKLLSPNGAGRFYRWPRELMEMTVQGVMAEIGQCLTDTVQRLRQSPVKLLKNEHELAVIYRLASLPQPVAPPVPWNLVDPERSGVPCGDEPILLTDEMLQPLDRELCDDLACHVSSWRQIVCCWWAARIVLDLLTTLGDRQPALPIFPGLIVALAPAEPIRAILELPGADDAALERLRKLTKDAQFGSAQCEQEGMNAFHNWIGSVSIDSLLFNQVSEATARELLIVTAQPQSQRRLDCRLDWDSQHGCYRLRCLVKKVATTGYTDDGTEIPYALLQDFFAASNAVVRSHLMRLALRGSWRRAQDLLCTAMTDYV